jgi:dTDP-glucose 4,6-dehydratase
MNTAAPADGPLSAKRTRPVLVTGGAGFIGANFVLDWLAKDLGPVVTLDMLTYAGNLDNLSAVMADERHLFVRGDIGDFDSVAQLLAEHRPGAVVNFAAESHVDRSIHGPADFIGTNVVATFRLLEAVRAYFGELSAAEKDTFRFLHVSTDEVFGSLTADEPPFTERNRYAPNSPYAASKAASDHLVRAWHHTYGLPALITNCSNNYGPFQFPEKLIPLMVHNALKGLPLPVYGDGRQVRDWLYVGDHCSAIRAVLAGGKPGETYNIGGNEEKANIEVIRMLCGILDAERPRADGRAYETQISFVTDRPGHDRRYAMDTGRIARELQWRAEESFATGLRKTVRWYLANAEWVDKIVSGAYRNWISTNYGSR